jgi:hypothetical protein
MTEQTQPPNALFTKLAGFQAIIPIFDNNSVVTPKFFLDSLDHVTDLAKCTDDEKLLILQSRIRGDALSHFINSPDLAQEKNYARFKEKFLAFFENKLTLATRQQQFSNCHMRENESAKVYASRVTDVTLKFFGNINSKNEDVKSLVEQTKLSKFLDGLLPEFKKQVLMKDPQTFQEAQNFLELLQANSLDSNVTGVNNLQSNSLESTISSKDILTILEAHSQKTSEMVASLTKQFEEFKMNTSQNIRQPARNTRSSYTMPAQTFPPQSFNNYSRPLFTQHRFVSPNQRFQQCIHCRKTNHRSENCFYAPSAVGHPITSRGSYNGRYANNSPRFHAPNGVRHNRYGDRFSNALNE